MVYQNQMNLVAVRANGTFDVLSDGPFQVSIGLGASIVLLILVLTFSASMGRSNPYVNGMGFLQAIWVFEHHPELSEILEQVADPTDHNLRVAGLVKVRLLDALSLQEN
jgi:hypothetical protein